MSLILTALVQAPLRSPASFNPGRRCSPGGYGVLDGVDLAMHARRMYAGMPLLVASGYAPQLMSRLGALEPAAVFIGKPYELRQISATLRRLTSEL